MSKGTKNIILIVLLAIGVGISFLLIKKEMITYAIITGTLSIIILLLLVSGLFNNRTPEESFTSFMRDILKTFDAVLINSADDIETDGRSLLKVSNFEDLIDAQVEIRKPICYKRDDRSTLFVLLDEKTAYYCIVKVDEKEESPFDKWVKEQQKKKLNFDKNLLSDIENTTIVKIDNNKSYKISPVKNNNTKKEVKEIKKVTESLEGLPKLKDTMDISKTQLFKDLNKRVKAANND
jgi:hypothetical protein